MSTNLVGVTKRQLEHDRLLRVRVLSPGGLAHSKDFFAILQGKLAIGGIKCYGRCFD